MKTLKRFRATLVAASICFICLVFYLSKSPTIGYATTYEAAKTLGGYMANCSGGVIRYGSQGFRCDAYGPSKTATVVLLVGVSSFIIAIVTLVARVISKPSI